jgi:hypothetical protein
LFKEHFGLCLSHLGAQLVLLNLGFESDDAVVVGVDQLEQGSFILVVIVMGWAILGLYDCGNG